MWYDGIIFIYKISKVLFIIGIILAVIFIVLDVMGINV